MRPLQTSQRFVGITVALFLSSAAMTIAQCDSNSLRDLSMCSGRTVHGAATFIMMWSTMMMAMMLPSLMPMLLHFRRSITAAAQSDALTLLVGLGYFAVWTLAGLLAFAGSVLLAAHHVTAQAGFVGAVVLIAGALQFSRWKARHLACCRNASSCCSALSTTAWSAWRHGLRLGKHCVHCCLGLTVVLLVVGMMDWRAMALVTIAITVERLAPRGLRVERFVGVVLVAMGVFLIAHSTTP